jgi:hypothetical protein
MRVILTLRKSPALRNGSFAENAPSVPSCRSSETAMRGAP